MIVEVNVKTSSKSNSVLKVGSVLKISLKSKAIKNTANTELVDTLSKYFNVSKSSVKILKGLKSKKKLIEILEE